MALRKKLSFTNVTISPAPAPVLISVVLNTDIGVRKAMNPRSRMKITAAQNRLNLFSFSSVLSLMVSFPL